MSFLRKRPLLSSLLLVLLLACVAWWGLPWLVSLPPALGAPLPPGQRVLARDGTPLRHLLNADSLRVGEPIHLQRAPEALLQATLAAEDQRFYSHGGVDLLALARALRDALLQGPRSGASTLTMQLVKVSQQPRAARTLQTKLLEMLQARQLEMRWEKERILQEYLDRVGYGNLFTGITAAAQGYLSKPVQDLSLAECSFLAALPQAPSRLNPFRDAAAVKPRQRYILERMKALGFIGKEELELAAGEAIVLQRHHGGFLAPHAVQLALQGTEQAGTLRTTVDAVLQQQVERIVQSRVAALREKGVEHAAVVVIENQTGHVLALVGSRDFSAAEGGQINGAWEPRSPGSAVKPFTYALAMEQSGGPASIVPDLPVEYPTPTGLYKPQNYDGRCYGPMTFRMALGNSLNLSAVRVLQSVGGATTLQSSLQKLGVTTLTEAPEHYGLGLTIGNAPMRLLELTNAYACLARLGDYRPWALLPQASSTVPSERFCSTRTAWFVADILQDNAARAITFGSQSVLRLPFRAAVKTGTSTNYRDNWCLGYVPEFTVGVWVGNFQGQPMNQVSGVTGAAPIWRDVMLRLKANYTLSWYAMPSDVQRGRIDLRTGKQLSAQLPTVRHSRTEVWAKDRPPALAQRSDYEMGSGKAILSPEFEPWISSADNWLGDSVTARSTQRYQPLRISAPTSGLIILSGQRILLRAEPSDGVQWSSSSLQIVQELGQSWATGLRPGRHTIQAKRGDATARSTVEVKATP